MELTVKMTTREQAISAIKTINSLYRLNAKIDFEDFLMDKHAEQYEGFKGGLVDDFPKWVQDLEVDDLIKYGNQYAEKMRLK